MPLRKLFRLHLLGHNHLINDYAMLWKTSQLSNTLILAIEIHWVSNLLLCQTKRPCNLKSSEVFTILPEGTEEVCVGRGGEE